MATLRALSRFTLILTLMPLCACIRAPLEITLDKELGITEEEVADIAEKIYDNLAELDFSETTTCPHVECSAAYKVWLRKQFNRGLLPRGLISPLVYGESGLSAHPAIANCRHIDFDKEYQDATEQSAGTSKREAIVMTLGEIREKLKSTKCSDNFIDPDKEKIQIYEMNLKIIKNNLTVRSPIYKIYTSDNELTKEDFDEPDAEATQIKNGIISELAKTKPVPPYFIGLLPAELESDQQKFSYAEVPLVSLSGSVAAIPSAMATEPEIKTVAGADYYVVPKGSLTLKVNMKFKLLFTLADPKCVYEQFKDSIRKEEEERRKQGKP